MSDLASELRDIANSVRNSTTKLAAASIAEIVESEARQAAREGRLFLHIWLHDRGWSRTAVEVAAAELRLKSLQVKVDNEIVAWYSNTDCDSADFIEVSWK